MTSNSHGDTIIMSSGKEKTNFYSDKSGEVKEVPELTPRIRKMGNEHERK